MQSLRWISHLNASTLLPLYCVGKQ